MLARSLPRLHQGAWVGDEQGGERLYLPYHEMSNIQPSRILGGAFSSFLVFVGHNVPTMMDSWNAVGACLPLPLQTTGEEEPARKWLTDPYPSPVHHPTRRVEHNL